MKNSLVSLIFCTLCFFSPLLSFSLGAQDNNLQTQALDVLTNNCLSCHSGKKPKAGLDLTTPDKILQGAHSGPILVPGKSSLSPLIHLVLPKAKPHMPPKEQITEEEIASLKKWIDSLPPTTPVGRGISEEDRAHWSFQKYVRHPLPRVKKQSWVKSPIDAFILSRLESQGLSPAPPATRLELIRRATFDLIGLPPTPEEVDAFLKDQSPTAYETLLDRLLASPHYGERWGRHWLDLARYAESNGIGEDKERPHAWRYRDYVIKSFNEDKPFAQFIREQLAGDEIDPTNHDFLTATGFCRHAPTVDVIRPADAEKYRLEEMDDVLSTTSQVFLGLTLGCARCHDHKYDPILQSDYYRFLAVFNSTKKVDVPLGKQEIDPKTKKPKEGPSIMSIIDIGPKPRTTNLLWRGDFHNKGPEVHPGVPVVLTNEPIPFPEPKAGAKSTGRRTVLADWIAHPDNPLTWRVLANRLWQYHFGRGIVASSNNFGFNGDRPTHPELLDWLALELLARDGRLKSMHKLIMTSNAYLQSSQHNEKAAKIDPDNLLWWRLPRKRLEAEPIRDAVLFVSGKLNIEMGGPSTKPRIHPGLLNNNKMTKWPMVAKEGPEHWRRSVYIYVKRSLQLPMMELMDAPSPTQPCERRVESIVATQALMFLNGEFINEQAAYFAQRIQKEAGNEVDRQIDHAFRLALSRAPDNTERQEIRAFLQTYTLVDLCQVLLASNEFVYVN
jgi:mono/diheme cytochrome c family protein